jgi:hypothetical protein
MSTLDLSFDMLEVPANGVASARVKQLKIGSRELHFPPLSLPETCKHADLLRFSSLLTPCAQLAFLRGRPRCSHAASTTYRQRNAGSSTPAG